MSQQGEVGRRDGIGLVQDRLHDVGRHGNVEERLLAIYGAHDDLVPSDESS